LLAYAILQELGPVTMLANPGRERIDRRSAGGNRGRTHNVNIGAVRGGGVTEVHLPGLQGDATRLNRCGQVTAVPGLTEVVKTPPAVKLRLVVVAGFAPHKAMFPEALGL